MLKIHHLNRTKSITNQIRLEMQIGSVWIEKKLIAN